MEKHIDADETQDWWRCPMCIQWFHEACFEQCFFCLINLSDGLIFLIFVFDLRLAVFDVLFLNYMFPISL